MRQTLALLILSALLSACATLVSGTNQQISINSNVRGARVYLNGQMIGKTPLNIQVRKQQYSNLVVKKKGYESISLSMTTSIPVAFWGNIITGGFFGSTTDVASGAIYEYSPTNYYADLEKSGSSKEASSDEDEDDEESDDKDEKPTKVKEDDDEASIRKFRRLVLTGFPMLQREAAQGGGEFAAALAQVLRELDRPAEMTAILLEVQTSDNALELLHSLEGRYDLAES